MNIIIILKRISLFIFFIAIIHCSLFRDVQPEQKIKGRIFITGNEPFTRLALEDMKGKVYYLQCSDKIQETLWDLQGKEVLIYYESIDKNEAGRFVKVKKYIIINKEHER